MGALSIAHGRTLIRELEARAAQHPDKPWLIFQPVDGEPLTLTYTEFVEKVNRTASVLRGCGVGSGDKLLLLLSNCPEFLFLWFGAARIGAVIVPVNPVSSDAELDYLASHSEAVLIAVHAADIARAERLRLRRIVIGVTETEGSFTSLLDRASTSAPDMQTEGEVAILYTSGTTSRPKGCLITHANYIHVGEAVAQHVGLRPDDRVLVVLPYFHGNAQYYSTMSALVTGATLVVTDRFSASRFWDIAATHHATIVSLFAA